MTLKKLPSNTSKNLERKLDLINLHNYHLGLFALPWIVKKLLVFWVNGFSPISFECLLAIVFYLVKIYKKKKFEFEQKSYVQILYPSGL